MLNLVIVIIVMLLSFQQVPIKEPPKHADKRFTACVVLETTDKAVVARCEGEERIDFGPVSKWPSTMSKERGTKFYFEVAEPCGSIKIYSVFDLDTCLVLPRPPTCD